MTIYRTGPETSVSTAAGTQESPAVAVLADGGWCVTWFDQSSFNIVYKAFTSSGEEIAGGDQVVNEVPFGTFMPGIAALKDGGWVITWQSDQEGTNDIYQRRYDHLGHPGAVVTVNTNIASEQREAHVT